MDSDLKTIKRQNWETMSRKVKFPSRIFHGLHYHLLELAHIMCTVFDDMLLNK